MSFKIVSDVKQPIIKVDVEVIDKVITEETNKKDSAIIVLKNKEIYIETYQILEIILFIFILDITEYGMI